MAHELPTAHWIRIAGHTGRIRKGNGFPWRCYIGSDPKEIPLRGVRLLGIVTPANCFFETNPTGDERGLIAWIRCYGLVTIREDGYAEIEPIDPAV